MYCPLCLIRVWEAWWGRLIVYNTDGKWIFTSLQLFWALEYLCIYYFNTLIFLCGRGVYLYMCVLQFWSISQAFSLDPVLLPELSLLGPPFCQCRVLKEMNEDAAFLDAIAQTSPPLKNISSSSLALDVWPMMTPVGSSGHTVYFPALMLVSFIEKQHLRKFSSSSISKFQLI